MKFSKFYFMLQCIDSDFLAFKSFVCAILLNPFYQFFLKTIFFVLCMASTFSFFICGCHEFLVYKIINLYFHYELNHLSTWNHTLSYAHALNFPFFCISIVIPIFKGEGIHLTFLYLYNSGLSLLINYHQILNIYFEILCTLIGNFNPFIGVTILILLLTSCFNYSPYAFLSFPNFFPFRETILSSIFYSALGNSFSILILFLFKLKRLFLDQCLFIKVKYEHQSFETPFLDKKLIFLYFFKLYSYCPIFEKNITWGFSTKLLLFNYYYNF